MLFCGILVSPYLLVNTLHLYFFLTMFLGLNLPLLNRYQPIIKHLAFRVHWSCGLLGASRSICKRCLSLIPVIPNISQIWVITYSKTACLEEAPRVAASGMFQKFSNQSQKWFSACCLTSCK